MTLSKQDIINLFKMLDFGGCKSPAIFSETSSLPIAIDVWMSTLADITADDMKSACLAFLRSPDARFWPTPGQLLALVPSRAVAAIDGADAAWGDLIRLVQRHGWYQPPTSWDRHEDGKWLLDRDESRCRAMDAGLMAVGGWRALCEIDSDESRAAARASFRASFRATLERQRLSVEHAAIDRLLQPGGGLRLLGGGREAPASPVIVPAIDQIAPDIEEIPRVASKPCPIHVAGFQPIGATKIRVVEDPREQLRRIQPQVDDETFNRLLRQAGLTLADLEVA